VALSSNPDETKIAQASIFMGSHIQNNQPLIPSSFRLLEFCSTATNSVLILVFYVILRCTPLYSNSLDSSVLSSSQVQSSELLYDLQFTVNQLVLDPRPLRFTARIISSVHLWLESLCNILSDEKMDFSFTMFPGPRQRIYSEVVVPHDS
jgi:hypothetical protein